MIEWNRTALELRAILLFFSLLTQGPRILSGPWISKYSCWVFTPEMSQNNDWKTANWRSFWVWQKDCEIFQCLCNRIESLFSVWSLLSDQICHCAWKQRALFAVGMVFLSQYCLLSAPWKMKNGKCQTDTGGKSELGEPNALSSSQLVVASMGPPDKVGFSGSDCFGMF